MQSGMIAIGVVFSTLAALSAYVISYHEYRQRMLRIDQNPKKMAMGTAVATFIAFLTGAVILSFVL